MVEIEFYDRRTGKTFSKKLDYWSARTMLIRNRKGGMRLMVTFLTAETSSQLRELSYWAGM